jgi:hypothetical protein
MAWGTGRSLVLLATCVVMLLTGCGESGSNPPVLPEVQFQVGPCPSDVCPGGAGAPVTFTVQSLFNGSVLDTSLADMQFTTDGTFNIYLEGAVQPYGGCFVQVGDSDILVRELINIAEQGTPQPAIRACASQNGPLATLVLPGSSNCPDLQQVCPSPIMPVSPNPEVRFQVCAPRPGESSCMTSGDSGIAGITFTGSVGDANFTHEVGQQVVAATPSIYFLIGASDSVNGVFDSISGQFLIVQLWINGQLRQTSSGTGSVVVREDL